MYLSMSCAIRSLSPDQQLAMYKSLSGRPLSVFSTPEKGLALTIGMAKQCGRHRVEKELKKFGIKLRKNPYLVGPTPKKPLTKKQKLLKQQKAELAHIFHRLSGMPSYFHVPPRNTKIIPCEKGSKQEMIVQLLNRPGGVAMAEILEKIAEIKPPWKASSVRTTMQTQLCKKGYGVRTYVASDGYLRYCLLLPLDKNGVEMKLPECAEKEGAL